MSDPATTPNPKSDESIVGLDTNVRMLVPRAGGRVIARFTTTLMILVAASPSQVYLTAIAIAVTWIAIAVGWGGSINLPGFLGRISGQLREHLHRVVADWLTVAAYLIVGLLWAFLSPRPKWLMAMPVVLTATACWTAQFAALPPGAMRRWFAFQWQLIREGVGVPFRSAPAAPEKESVTKGPAPAPINPFEATMWPSQQQDRFDDWLAEEVTRFESEDATSAGNYRPKNMETEDSPESTKQLSSLRLSRGNDDDAADDTQPTAHQGPKT